MTSRPSGPRHLLLVHAGHPGGRTEQLRRSVEEGIREIGAPLETRVRAALQCTADDLLGAAGLILGTPEHFGYMAGALKDFFDRTYYPAEGKTSGLPYALFVSAGTDGTGTVRAVERIATGYGWTAIAPALVVVGDPDAAALRAAHELGATMAAGLEANIF